VLPATAQPGVDLTHGDRRVSRETLRVTGLDAGKYEIVIDDVVVAEVRGGRLVLPFDLQSNDKTPQYQQALIVANLNEAKNNGPVGALRNAWRDFQGYARVKRGVVASSENEALKKKLASLKERMTTLDERVAAAQQEISQFDDQIYEANKPQSRHFVIRKVTKS